MLLYRVDKRYFNKNEIISPVATFEEGMKGLQLEVEKSLDEFRPQSVPFRKECLYVFCNLSSALIFCSKYGGYIYAVTIKPIDLYWKADMNMLDNIYEIFKTTKCKNLRESIVCKYWESGMHTFQPCYELLVRQAKVINIVLDEQNAKDLIKSEIDKFGTIENAPIFNSLFNDVIKNTN